MAHYQQIDEDEDLARRLQQEEEESAVGYRPPRDEVQRNDGAAVNTHIRENINIVQEQSPRILCILMTYYICEMIATATILAMYWNDPCDRPLKYFILFFSLRYLLVIPFRVILFRSTGPDAVSRLADFARKSLTWIDIGTFVWWIIGQVWLYGSETCANDNPGVYYYSLVLTILVYVQMSLPILILLGLCICLPCVLFVIQMVAEPRGAPEDVIQKLPKRSWDQDPARRAPNAPVPDPCSICRSEFQFGEEVRTLPCRHEFHTECVDQWLRIKPTCPLCRMSITAQPQEASNQV